MLNAIIDGSAPVGKQYPIQPHHLARTDPEDSEVYVWRDDIIYEVGSLVRFAQNLGAWMPFTRAQFETFGGDARLLDALTRDQGAWHFLHAPRGEQVKKPKFFFTHKFIVEVFTTAPASSVVPDKCGV